MKPLKSLIAPRGQTAEDKRREMLERPIQPLILSLAAPSIVANLVTSIYNLSDTFFVGQIGVTSATAAIGVGFVAMTLIQGTGFYFGQGIGNAMSRSLGAGDEKRATMLVNDSLVCTITMGLLIAIFGHVFLDALCLVGGATPTIMPYAHTYISIILCGAPFMCTSFCMNMLLRFQGESFYSMLAMVAGALLNMMLTPLLIFPVGLGIAGSAIATVISEFVSFLLLLREMNRAGITPLGRQYLEKPTFETVREVNAGGVPSLVRQMMLGVATSLLNNAARPFGDAAIAGIAIVQRITGFGNYVQIGIGQGFQPIIGYNLGAHEYQRVREGYFTALRLAFTAVAAISAVTFLLAPQLIYAFGGKEEVVEIATLTLRVCSVTLPFTGAAMITNFLLQSSGCMWRATLLGACRLGLVLGPVALVLPSILGLLGVQIAQGVTDVITALVAIPMALSILSELREREAADAAAA